MSYTKINGIPVHGKNLVRYLGLLKINPERDLRVTLPEPKEFFVHCPQCKGLGFEIMHYKKDEEFMTEIPCKSCHLKGFIDLRFAIELDFEIMNGSYDIILEDE